MPQNKKKGGGREVVKLLLPYGKMQNGKEEKEGNKHIEIESMLYLPVKLINVFLVPSASS